MGYKTETAVYRIVAAFPSVLVLRLFQIERPVFADKWPGYLSFHSVRELKGNNRHLLNHGKSPCGLIISSSTTGLRREGAFVRSLVIAGRAPAYSGPQR